LFTIVGAFTIVEILLVLALIAVVSTVCIYNIDSFKETFFENHSPESVLTEAVKACRFYASKGCERCTLGYDERHQSFIVKNSRGDTCGTFALPSGDSRRAVRVQFLRAIEGDNTRSVWTPDTRELPEVTCDSNGLCAHLFVKITADKNAKVYRLEPFSATLAADKQR
jgi:hypothetical protein